MEYMLGQAATDSAAGGTSEILAGVDAKGFVQFSTDFITGSPASIARQLDEWAEIDVAGFMLVLTDYVEDIKRMGSEVFPLMKNFTPPTVPAKA
jgi:pyrimidine oxygenase